MVSFHFFPRSRRPRPTFTRPQLEALEGRTLLNNRFVVPAGVPIDDVFNFATLQAALTAPGLAAGNTIQIEPGSAPGNVTAAAPPVANLTIQGDPAAPLASVPMFTVSNPFTVAAAQAGFTLKNVNVGLVGAGTAAPANNGRLVFNADATVTDCTLVVLSSEGVDSLLTLGGARDVLTHTTVINNVAANIVVAVVTPAGGSGNLIANNTFITNSFTGDELAYQGGAGVAVADRVADNTFIEYPSAYLGTFLDIAAPVSGLVIQGNIFSGPGAYIGISQRADVHNLQIVGNTIDVGANLAVNPSNSVPRGIHLGGAGAGTAVSVSVADNRISTGDTGTGIEIEPGTAADAALNLKIQGNNLYGNKVGVLVTNGFIAVPGSVGGIDLGGGPLGSLGANNFRQFLAANLNAGAIVLNELLASQGTVHAQHNLFASDVPGAVVSDPAGQLDLASPLTGNAAFVAGLYEDVLRRAADTASATDAGPLVGALNAGTVTPAAAAAAVARSAEALGAVVDGLYQKLLGRAADAMGRASLVSFLQHGGTLEQVVGFLVASDEYAAAVGATDFGFVQSLYTRLLGRQAANSEVTGWLAQLPTLGRAGVAGAILSSPEFRGGAVRQLYGSAAPPVVSVARLLPALLHRGPALSPAEVNGWINSGLDLLSMAVTFAQTGEYFTVG